MSEAADNRQYQEVIRRTLEKGESFCPMRKEKQMDYLFAALAEDFQRKGLQVLDACCGYGRLIHFLNEFDNEQRYTGIDYVQELVEQGRRSFAGRENVNFLCHDLLKLPGHLHKSFDIAINYKTLSWLPYYKEIMKELIAATREKIYITSLFYDGDIDFITRIYTDAQEESGNSTFLNTYSLPKFTRYCLSLGAKEVKATEMKLDFDLPQPEDVNTLQTYTVPKKDGGRLEITGSVVLNWKLVEVVIG